MPPSKPNDETFVPESGRPDGEQVGEWLKEFNIPETIGRYTVGDILGRGGFGTVVLATDEELGRQVAIKIIRAHVSGTEWLNEARLVAALDHEHIVPIYDVGRTEDGFHYMVWKFIKGQTLRDRIGSLTARQCCELVVVIAEALHYAHKHGVVHRDIKPANILLNEDDRPFLVDFGVALQEGQNESPGVAAGTPSYMSPEQARGEGHRVDGRSDVFSLGIVLYQLLTGRKPFAGDSAIEILQQVQFREPRPLRQIDDAIPSELQRICLRALEKRASQRYLTASDFADDLKFHLANTDETEMQTAAAVDATGSNPDTHERLSTKALADVAAVVPRGLRSFEESDAEFFLSLLPGPYDRGGFPESVRFWKERIEEPDPKKTFATGLMYGPSGCGKSSLVKAGLLPQLSQHVISIYLEATPDQTESRLLTMLQTEFPQIPESLGLRDVLAGMRHGKYMADGDSLLIVIDQFEQWLHVPRSLPDCELVNALRQCDGDYLRCLLMIRDDFWMSASRFMSELEEPIQEGWNSAAVDLFDLRHARKVLQMLGVAFGRLPDRPADYTDNHHAFIKEAVAGIAVEERVVSVQLAVFAEMLKHREWTIETLRNFGGTQGLGVAFLEDAFYRRNAPPERRLHEHAARAVLKELLPEAGSNLKGYRKSEADLKTASGYSNRPHDFEALLKLLDNSLRLVTPVDNIETDQAGCSYQLAHDFLVPSLREWLTQKQRETAKGRAQLVLAERADMWAARKESKQLPSLVEWAQVGLMTRRSERNEREGSVMKAASKFHGRNLLGVFVLAAIALLSGFWIQSGIRKQRISDSELAKVNTLSRAAVSAVPTLLKELSDPSDLAKQKLQQIAASESETMLAQRNAQLALLAEEPEQITRLLDNLPAATPADVQLIADRCRECGIDATNELHQRIDNQLIPERQLPIYALLAQLNPADPTWQDSSPKVAQAIIRLPAIQSQAWSKVFQPLAETLRPSLEAAFHDSTKQTTERQNSATILAEHHPLDVQLLVDLVAEADAASYSVLYPYLKSQQTRATPLLRTLVANNKPVFEHTPGEIPPTLVAWQQQLQDAGGDITDKAAWCANIPEQEFESAATALAAAGYELTSLRPTVHQDDVVVAATWLKSNRRAEYQIGLTTTEEKESRQSYRDRALIESDISSYRLPAADDDDGLRHAVTWCPQPDDVSGALIWNGLDQSVFNQTLEYIAHESIPHATRRCCVDGHTKDQPGYSVIAWAMAVEPISNTQTSLTPEQFEQAEREHNQWTLQDLRVREAESAEGHSLVLDAVWLDGVPFESQRIISGSVADHETAANRLIRLGFHPVTLSSTQVDDSLRVASVWHRKIDESAKDKLATRQANAAITLARFGDPEILFDVLKDTPDPRLASVVVHRLEEFRCPPSILITLLKQDPPVDVRRLILAALSNYDWKAEIAATRQSTIQLASDSYANDPDAGVHSAAELLLKRLGRDLPEFEQPPPKGNWFRNSHGDTFATVNGPVEFQMGSPPQTVGRVAKSERRRQKLIPRSFAIATTEVTVEQFLKFKPDHNYSLLDSPNRDSPINNVKWIEAVRYCRWLSEQEKLPEDQMCYPPLDQILEQVENRLDGEYLKLPADYLTRTGYRLPTEAEWEYACRAGTTTSRYSGQTEMLFDSYAWTYANSYKNGQASMQSVGQLLPNRLGLFDMLGNALEHCQCSHDASKFGRFRFEDSENEKDVADGIIFRNGARQSRGGGHLYPSRRATSSHRDLYSPPAATGFNTHQGFRIARTVSVPVDD